MHEEGKRRNTDRTSRYDFASDVFLGSVGDEISISSSGQSTTQDCDEKEVETDN